MLTPRPHTIRLVKADREGLTADVPAFERFGFFVLAVSIVAVALLLPHVLSANTRAAFVVRQPVVLACVLAFFALTSITRVHRVSIDRQSNRYEAVAGFGPLLRRRAGPLNDFDGVAITKTESTAPIWTVVLHHPGGDHLVVHGRVAYFSFLTRSIERQLKKVAASVAEATSLAVLE